ncbi:MAG TPA: AMP-binding protein [Acidimicrobiales bacterium]|nr:AMP-binding protein [Acidimicrobiales bacterium]
MPSDVGVEAPATIAHHVVARGDDPSPGLIFEGRTWSWAEVVAESVTRSAMLRSLCRPGPFHVGVLLENLPEYVFLLLGSALCGTTVVGVNPTRRGEELAGDVRHTDCQIVVTDEGGSKLLAGMDLGSANGRVLVAGSREYDDLLSASASGGAPVERPGPGDLYLLVFTAGSTGAPKAVRVSQGRAARTAADSARAFRPDDVLYCAMPLFHGNALLANLFPALITGASVVLRRRFSASSFGPDIRYHGCTFFNYVGRALSYIVAVPEAPEDRDNKLKWALGSEASPQNIAEFTRRFHCPVFEGYGSSENAVVIVPAPGMPRGAMGKAKPGTDVAVVDPATGAECAPAVVDEQGRLLNPDEAIGEIVGRDTADRFEGYYNNPEAEAARTRDGWYWTGDLGYRDAESFIYFAGRTADWLRVDGENFSAGSVERVLNRYPWTTGAAVFGVPDPVSGDQVMAALETEGTGRFDAGDFATFLSEQPDLGTKWAPRFVRLVARLPTTGSGKLDKSPLRARAWCVDDPVWWRPGRELEYRLLDDADAAVLRESFVAAGRERFLPAAPSR